MPAQSPAAGIWAGGWILTVGSLFFFEETTLCYSCTLPTKSNGKDAELPRMEMCPASSHTPNDLCELPLAPVSELEGRGGFSGIPRAGEGLLTPAREPRPGQQLETQQVDF